MNIITNYQAKEIALKKFNKRREESWEIVKELYLKYKGFKKVVDKIFDGIRANAEKGEFICIIDVSYKEFQEHLSFYEDMGTVLQDGLGHLGYSVSANPMENQVSLWIEWA